MSAQAWLTLAVVVLTVWVLAKDLVSPVLAVLGADILLLLFGVITPEQALAGFSNPAPITVAALFVVAAAVEKTGALQPLISGALGNGGGGRGRLARLLVPTAAASAFLNNTPIVAMLAPQVSEWANKRGQPASWYLMPISFATILGGLITVMGTSTNLVASGLMQQAGMEPIGMFELSRIGLPVAAVGVLMLIVLSTRLLPDRRTARQTFEENVREYVVHMLVAEGGALDAQTVEGAGLRQLQGVFLVEIERGGQVIAPPTPETVLRGGDRLTFAGRVDLIRDLQGMRGLVSTEQRHALEYHTNGHTFFEVVVSGASSLAGKTLKQADFRSRYQAAVLGIHRAGQRVNAKLGEVPLREGDTLLVLADSGFGRRWRHSSEFLLVSRLGGTPRPSTRSALLVGAIAFGVVVVAGLGLLPILHASLVGALALVATRVLTPSEARNAVELDTLVVIAASFGLGTAIERSGLAQLLAHGISTGSEGFGPLGVLFAVVLATMALTELITNNAAAVLMFPIGLAAASGIGADPRPFAIALTIAASCSFLTPIGYQTNTMIYGMGGYRFGDFIRLGAPLTLIVLITILLFVPLFWPF